MTTGSYFLDLILFMSLIAVISTLMSDPFGTGGSDYW